MNSTWSIPLSKLLKLFAGGICGILMGCGKRPPPIQLLASDVHVTIGGRNLTLPFVALEDYAYRKTAFSLDPRGDQRRARKQIDDFMRDGRKPGIWLAFNDVSVLVRTYGWNDDDMRQRDICPLLTRAWARSVCDNPWAAVQQALPVNRFKLVDLDQFSKENWGQIFACSKNNLPAPSIPKEAGEAIMACKADVVSDKQDFYRAVVRVDGRLGAIWTVGGNNQNGESAEAMAHREGRAISSFVENALGTKENFAKLRADMCRLRRPKSADGPNGTECRNQADSLMD